MEEKKNEIILFENQGVKLEVNLKDETVWLTQGQMSKLFKKSKSTINEHIKNIYKEGELIENETMTKFGNSEFSTKPTNYYNLDMIIAVGFRVKSNEGTKFRIWANKKLKDYLVKGYNINVERFKNNGTDPYFDELLDKIRDIRSSEKVFWRKILDIYATSVDYDPKSKITQDFFKTVQNKMHWAVHGHTAAEIIVERADGNKDFMGLTTFSGDCPTLSDAREAKNYLTDKELDILNRIVSMYLDYAELQAIEEKTMTMQDWIKELNYFLMMNRKDILKGAGKVSHEEALNHAKKEYDKYKNRIALKPSEVELHYLQSIKDLEMIDTKN